MVRGARVPAAMMATAVVIVGAPMRAKPTGVRVETAAASAAQREPAVNFHLREIDGSWINLSQFRGHPVIVDFWATWCPPCRRQIPELMDLYKRYHKAAGLVVLGVSVDSVQGRGVQAARDFAQELAINYPIVMATPAVLDNFGILALPTTFFIGRDGRIVSQLRGTGDPGELTSHLKGLIAGGKGRTPRKSRPADDGVINL
jgi:cytochrome c biogenesis protein CcmG, thiol:disulfide interchange protein DsbE